MVTLPPLVPFTPLRPWRSRPPTSGPFMFMTKTLVVSTASALVFGMGASLVAPVEVGVNNSVHTTVPCLAPCGECTHRPLTHTLQPEPTLALSKVGPGFAGVVGMGAGFVSGLVSR